MKKLWDMFSFIAVVNLLVLLLFVGWLWHADRLDVERLREVRAILASTIAEDDAKAAAEAAAEDERQAALTAEEERLHPPLPSAAQVSFALLAGDQARQATRRLQDETDQHQAALALRSSTLDRRDAELDERERAWNASIADEVQRRSDEQLRKTVQLYEALAGKQAKRMLLELVDSGMIDRAVGYLDAMSTRAAAKTLKEMKTDVENELAIRLLERIRVFGLESEARELSGNERPTPISG
jgi:acyl transferase domain-containing protein